MPALVQKQPHALMMGDSWQPAHLHNFPEKESDIIGEHTAAHRWLHHLL
jgi:hypothetical protein